MCACCFIRDSHKRFIVFFLFFFFQAEDGIRDLVRSRGLGDVYKRQPWYAPLSPDGKYVAPVHSKSFGLYELSTGKLKLFLDNLSGSVAGACLLYTSDAADERSSVDLGGRRIIKKKNIKSTRATV